jgi:hypothetical protein
MKADEAAIAAEQTREAAWQSLHTALQDHGRAVMAIRRTQEIPALESLVRLLGEKRAAVEQAEREEKSLGEAIRANRVAALRAWAILALVLAAAIAVVALFIWFAARGSVTDTAGAPADRGSLLV